MSWSTSLHPSSNSVRLNLDVVTAVFDDVVKGTQIPPDLISITFHRRSGCRPASAVYPTLCNVAVCLIVVKIALTVFLHTAPGAFSNAEMAHGNVFILTVQEEYTDTDKVRHVFPVIINLS